jgi:hypothetical protein
LILLRGKRSGKIVGLWREVFSTNERGLQGVAVGGEIVQQPAETNEVLDAGFVAEGRLLFTQRAEPAEQMGIAAQLGEPANLRESGAEISEEAARSRSIVVDRARPQSEGKRLDMSFQELFEVA